MIISHEHPLYAKRFHGHQTYNGAFYYSKEIVEKIIPNIKTDRNWVTININGQCRSHSIVFIHNNKNPLMYEWLSRFSDLVLVCGVPDTCDKVRHLGKAIYLPLSVDVEYVKKFKQEKKKEVAYVGRAGKRERMVFPQGTDFIEGLMREDLLREMAKYKQIYAVGRTAIEGKILGCEILPFDSRFPNPSMWRIFDCKEACEILQRKLDAIDRR